MPGWQGVCLVAVTYVYFLIFAQFAFLARVTALGVDGAAFKAVMAAMASGGILLSLLAPRIRNFANPALRLRAGLAACGAAAFLSLLQLGIAGAIACSFLIGAGLGLLTVTLVTNLRQWTGSRNALLKVGLGTGIGYFLCNVPAVFTASPMEQALFAGLLCVAAVLIPLGRNAVLEVERSARGFDAVPFLAVLAAFSALVWLDSAAFFIIQQTPVLKAGTWAGSVHLWTNGGVHLVAALGSAWLLQTRRLTFVLTAAFLFLGCACLLLLDPGNSVAASVLYPAGVSLYSVALVAYPALLSRASSTAERGRQAGWLYAVAGWIGSAMGIGMGQNLGHVPLGFLVAAGAVILTPTQAGMKLLRRREFALPAALLVVAYCASCLLGADPAPVQLSQVEHGRQVYISEGCINCHSQYVRPNTSDELMWGPVLSVEEVHRQRPPLIGNRRQGPDLSEVGSRRSPLWLKAHFFDPRDVSGASIMPAYGFLFSDERGDDLVAYLRSLHGPDAQHLQAEAAWTPGEAARAAASAREGGRLFALFCRTCHDAGGNTRWEGRFKRLPPDLTVGPYLHLEASWTAPERLDHLARIVKFGIPGTDMPGHEYLADKDIASLSLWLSQTIAQPSPTRSFPPF